VAFRVSGQGVSRAAFSGRTVGGKSGMTLIRLLLCLKFALVALFVSPQAFAQGRDAGDQPGYVPNAADEQLDPKWQKAVVFYRTTEAPGTVIVHTDERYLYVVHPAGRALRY